MVGSVHHPFFGHVPDSHSILSAINLDDELLLLVEFDYWSRHLVVGSETLDDNLLSIVSTAASLCTFKASFSADLF